MDDNKLANQVRRGIIAFLHEMGGSIGSYNGNAELEFLDERLNIYEGDIENAITDLDLANKKIKRLNAELEAVSLSLPSGKQVE